MVFLLLSLAIMLIAVIVAVIMKTNDDKSFIGVFSFVFILLMLLNTFFNSIAYTSICDRKVQTWLNQPQPGYVSNGLQFMMPMFDTESFNVCRRQVEFTGEETLKGTAKGGMQIEIMDAVIPIRLLPDHLWRVRSLIGGEFELFQILNGSARSAGRIVQSQYEWRDLVYSKRNEIEIAFSKELMKRLTIDLVGAGLTSEEAENVFVIPEVRLRDVKPSQSILDEQGNYEQALVQRDTATVRIETSKSDGAGVNEFIDRLTIKPNNMAELADFLRAFADLERARALARISADDKRDISVMVLPSSIPMGIQVPTTRSATPE